MIEANINEYKINIISLIYYSIKNILLVLSSWSTNLPF